MLQKAYFYPSNYGIRFLYELVLSMNYLSVVKLISEGTDSNTNCWITERGGVLSLQETLLGCNSEMPGNLIFLETIFSIIGVGLDQDEYLNLWIIFSRQS
jgi:hypothetical protein